MQFMDRKQNFTLNTQKSQLRRDNIRNAFYYGIMQLVQRPQMTATEFLGFQEENLRLMAPNLVRIQTGGLSPLISRRYNILNRAGQLPPPPPELQGRILQIEYVSPLAKVQQMADGKAILQVQAAIEQMALTDPTVRDNFNGDEAARILSNAYTSQPRILRDPNDVQKMREARAKMQAQQMQLAAQEQQVNTMATAAHAQQAGSLAQNRQQGNS